MPWDGAMPKREETMRSLVLNPAKSLAAVLLFALGALAGGCTPVGAVVGIGATTAVAATEERGVGGAAADTKIRLAINDSWFKSDVAMLRRLNLQVYEGRVLVSGVVPNEAMRAEAIRLAWMPDGVREVINEVRIGASPAFDTAAQDTLITNRLKTRLLVTKGIDAVNYSIRTVNGVIYLLGIAQDDAELQRVIAVARDITGAEGIVNHVILKDDPRRAS